MQKIRLVYAIAITLMLSAAANAQIDVSLSVQVAPPALPVYTQPECPNDGYLWSPGYWAYGPDGYYWVPGVWVSPPNPGLLWTPCYWGYDGGNYVWHTGYWGPHVGFYGGINYGYGYGGEGFGGGRWEGNRFRYNTAVVNVNTNVVHNTYVDRTVINNTVVNNHTSFNGQGGVRARPTPQEQTAAHESHVSATPEQNAHHAAAGKDHNQLASVNNGRPSNTAMSHVNGKPVDQQGHEAAKASAPRANAVDNTNSQAAESKARPENKPVQASRPAAAQRPVEQARPAPERAASAAAVKHDRPQAQQHAPVAKPHPAPVHHAAPPERKN